MPWSGRSSVRLVKSIVDRRRNVQVVLLQEHKMAIALDANLAKLNPLEVADAHLLEVLDEAVIIGDVRGGLACDHDVGHLADLSELVDGASLEHAGAVSG